MIPIPPSSMYPATADNCSVDINALAQKVNEAIYGKSYDVAIDCLTKIPEGQTQLWNLPSPHRFALINACMDKDAPAELYELLIQKEVCLGISLPPAPNSETAVIIAARAGNLTALKVFSEKGCFSDSEWTVAAAWAHGAKEIDACAFILAETKVIRGPANDIGWHPPVEVTVVDHYRRLGDRSLLYMDLSKIKARPAKDWRPWNGN